MRLTFVVLVTVVISHSSCTFIKEQNISKVICQFRQFENADVFKGALEMPIRMTKVLFRQCKIKVKIVFDLTAFDSTTLISFAYYGSNNKESGNFAIILIKGLHDCKTKFDLHSMAIGNLNKSKETKPTTTTALKAVPLSTKN